MKVNKDNPVICWFSGGVTSAVAVNDAIQIYGIENCRIVFIDTMNEDKDTYRFLDDCEKLYGKSIEMIKNHEYKKIQDVWIKFTGLNFAHGAICSSELKRAVRLKFQAANNFSYQVFGFDTSEPNRAKSFTLNYSNANAIYPLLFHGRSKVDCITILEGLGIDIPRVYKWGFHNNNCMKTGCVQGGIGYWQLMHKKRIGVYDAMADMEHYLTGLAGKPVTMCRHQSKEAKKKGNTLLFLKKHPDYPEIKTIMDVKGRPPKPLIDCNGYCGVNDLSERNKTELELNLQ